MAPYFKTKWIFVLDKKRTYVWIIFCPFVCTKQFVLRRIFEKKRCKIRADLFVKQLDLLPFLATLRDYNMQICKHSKT